MSWQAIWPARTVSVISAIAGEGGSHENLSVGKRIAKMKTQKLSPTRQS